MDFPNMTNAEQGRRRDAYHEASHAVFFHHAGASIEWAQITNEEGGGLISLEWPADPSVAQSVILSAGYLAGMYAAGKSDGEDNVLLTFQELEQEAKEGLNEMAAFMGCNPEDLKAMQPYETDHEQAYEALQLATNSSQRKCNSEECYEEVRNCLARGLEDWWHEIEAVATRLLEAKEGCLEGKEIVELIESAQQGEER